MTTPTASGTLYASVSDLRLVLGGTDAGTGTAAQLTDAQLTLALYRASNTVSIYFGNVMDSSTPQAVPPGIFHDFTLDLACFFAMKTYLKHKEMSPVHPVFIAYTSAMSMLNMVREGKLRLDPAVAGGIGEEVGTVINRIPPIFSGNDSNTRLDTGTGYLTDDVPDNYWTPRGTDWAGSGGAIYQG